MRLLSILIYILVFLSNCKKSEKERTWEEVLWEDFTNETIILLKNRHNYTQFVHPDIYYKDNKYYMAITPYPYSQEKFENPFFFISKNGYIFEEQDTLNPLAPRPQSGYNNDPDIILENNNIYINYLETNFPYYQKLIQLKKDKYNQWSSKTLIFNDKIQEFFFVSPSFVKFNNNFYAFIVNIRKDSIQYITTNDIEKIESKDFKTVKIQLENGDIPWHLDVFEKNGTYYMLLLTLKEKNRIYLFQSLDLKDWQFVKIILDKKDLQYLHCDLLYRATALIDDYQKLTIWFSFQEKNRNLWKVARLQIKI